MANSTVSRDDAALAMAGMDALLQQLHDNPFSKHQQVFFLEFLARARNSIDAAYSEIALAVEESKAYEDEQFVSAASYVAWVGGDTTAEAHNVLDTARTLRELPQLREDFAAGAISETRVRALAEGLTLATSDDQRERLQDLAQHETVASLQKQVRRLAAASKKPKNREEAERKQFLKLKPVDEFGYKLNGYLTNESIAKLKAQLVPEASRQFKALWKHNAFISREHCDALALVSLANRHVDGKEPRPHVSILVSLEALARGELLGNEVSEFVGIGPVDIARIQRLLSTAFIDLVFTSDVDMGTKARAMTAHMKRTLNAHEAGCSMLGCDGDIVEGDHNHEVRDGGQTTQSNMHKLCRPHHAIKTKYRMKLIGPPGRMRMVKVDPAFASGGSRAGP